MGFNFRVSKGEITVLLKTKHIIKKGGLYFPRKTFEACRYTCIYISIFQSVSQSCFSPGIYKHFTYQIDILVIETLPPEYQFDVVLSGSVRNDIYLTLEKAEFDRGRKKAEKNVEVVVTTLDSNGKEIPVSLFKDIYRIQVSPKQYLFIKASFLLIYQFKKLFVLKIAKNNEKECF